MLAALVVLAMLAVPLAVVGTASAQDGGRDLTPIVIGPQATDRLGGGAVVGVMAGDALFGVRYGTAEQANDLVIFAEYKRFLGGADVVDASGDRLATRGIPVVTLLAQELVRFIEFQHVNATDGYDLFSVDRIGSESRNLPVKALNLVTSWELSDLTNRTLDNVTYVDFTLTAMDLHYTRVLNETNLGDGMLNRVAFTFHLQVDIVDRRAEVPWYRVTVDDGNHYEITHVEFLGFREVSGPAVAMGAKYDHLIEGWDFASAENRLALETRMIFGNYIPERTAQFIHEALLRERADDGNGTYERDGRTLNETTRERPHLYTRDEIYFDDDYTRIARLRWATNVTVDGQDARMLFQVQGGGRLFLEHHGAYFVGFWIRGAYVYPAGDVIFHDPAVSAEAFLDLPAAVNLTPLTLLAVQAAVVGIAMGPALYLRARARRAK